MWGEIKNDISQNFLFCMALTTDYWWQVPSGNLEESSTARYMGRCGIPSCMRTIHFTAANSDLLLNLSRDFPRQLPYQPLNHHSFCFRLWFLSLPPGFPDWLPRTCIVTFLIFDHYSLLIISVNPNSYTKLFIPVKSSTGFVYLPKHRLLNHILKESCICG